MPNSKPSRLFVTGANGKLGRSVIEKLLDSGTIGIVAGSRNPEALADLAVRGVDVHRADFDDPASLDIAFDGIDHLLIISVLDTPDDPSRRLRQHLSAVEAAVKAGVKHITYTSMQNPEHGSPIPFAPDHLGTEDAIKATGIAHTILRSNWYTDIALFWLPPVLASGQLFSAAGDGRVAYLWRDDLAYAAATSLLAGGTDIRTLDISGPEALSPQQIIATVNEVFHTSVKVVPVSDAQLAAGLSSAGLPENQIAIFTAFDINTRLGRVDSTNSEFEQLTGRKPRSLREFLLAHRDALLAASKPSIT